MKRRAALAHQLDDRLVDLRHELRARGASTPATGEKAPMPPVLGPRSPSKIRLKSRAGAIAIARSPSHSATAKAPPDEMLLDEHRVGLEAAPDEQALERCARLAGVGGDEHDALARREPVGLDHSGIAGDRVHALLDALSTRPRGGRHAGLRHRQLGELL